MVFGLENIMNKEYLCWINNEGFVCFDYITYKFIRTKNIHNATRNSINNWLELIHNERLQNFVFVIVL
jgi:hypothetical protein